jgi:hypothetical protein
MNSGHLEGNGVAAPKEKLPVKAGPEQPPTVSQLNVPSLWLLGMIPLLSANMPGSKSKKPPFVK